MSTLDNINQDSKTKISSRIPVQTALAAIMIAAIVMIMIINVMFLTKVPPVFIDESWNANAAWNWLRTGNNFDSMHSGTLDQFGYEWLRWPKIGNFFWRTSFAFWGLGLFQARIVSWVFACLLLIATILLGRRTYGLLPGLLAAFILSLSTPFLQASHYARWDIMLPTIAMFAYWLALKGMEENKWWCHILAGLLIGLSLDIHQNAVLFMLGFAIMYLVFYGMKFFKSWGTWLFGLGAVLGIGYFIAMFIFPNPEAYFSLFSLSLGNTHRIPITTFNPMHILQSIDDEIGRYHFFENSLEFAMIGASAIYLVYRHNKYDRLLLSFITAVFSGFVLFIGNKHDVYAILLYPFFMLMVAETVSALIRDRKSSDSQRLFVASLLLLFLISSSVKYARATYGNRNYNYDSIIAEIEPVIPAGSRVMGMPIWWLGLADYDYSSSLNLTYYHVLNDYTLVEGFEEIKPDILILDRDLQALLVDEGAYQSNAGFQIYQLPRDEFQEILDSRGELIHGFWNPWHGSFDIYSLQWDEEN